MKNVFYVALAVVIAAGAYWLATPEGKARAPAIGVLQYTDTSLETLAGFKEAMAGYGYVEGESVRYLFDGPVPSLDQLEPAMERLLAQNPDMILASTTPAAKTAANMAAPRGIPVIFAPVNDPVSSGIVKNLRRPEGNVTGVRLSPSEGRRLQSLREIAPDIRRVFVPFNPQDQSAAATLAQISVAAPKIGLALVLSPFSKEMDVIGDNLIPEDVDAVFLPREGLVLSRIKDFMAVSLERRLPLSTPRFEQVERGALTGYGFVASELGKQAARLARQVFAGKPVKDLPVETARDCVFLNMASARQMGLHIPEDFLRRVNYIVYETQ